MRTKVLEDLRLNGCMYVLKGWNGKVTVSSLVLLFQRLILISFQIYDAGESGFFN